MTSLHVPFASVLVIVAVLLAAGCAGQAGDGKSSGKVAAIPITSSSVLPTLKSSNSSLAYDMGAALDSYRNNLTPSRKKIPEELLQLIDPNYPITGMAPATTRKFLISENQLIPADPAGSRFNINNTMGHPVGDQVHLIIHINSSASIHLADPVVISVENWNEEFHSIVAWVDLNNLERLAELDDIRSIRVVVPPEHS